MGLPAQLRPSARDVQVGAGQGGLAARAGPRHLLGKASDGNKTWTYTLRDGLKYEDGTPITRKDIKYGVARSLDKDVSPTARRTSTTSSTCLRATRALQGQEPDDSLKAIETPDDKTIVFHLKQPFAGFDYFAQLPRPRPCRRPRTPARSTRSTSSRAARTSSGLPDGQAIELVRNTDWDPATDPIRKALPDKITVEIGVNAADLDNRLMAGDLDIDLAGTGVLAAAQGKISPTRALKAHTDNPTAARLWYTAINSDVEPFDNIDCRKAVIYAADKTRSSAPRRPDRRW